ncbi:hypothetical protein B0T24DRAFT_715818 [Lasiosphaeria ovina]|uniref:Ankyrin repeat protein n=1 Tax=Lasiosphaeria ovina TaxID=92902 RepID=A0AAE0NME9_9PEZI|nr:hypothetical protein B0T24DRAFT_715818 [Lasiosphaeria ovina]
MAEILGVASSIAGLASLSIEIGKGVRALKARVAETKDLPDTVKMIEERLAVLEQIRQRLDNAGPGSADLSNSGAPDPGADILLKPCVDGYSAISQALASLQVRISAPGKRRTRLLRGLGDSSLLRELQAIDRLTSEAQTHFILAMMAMTHSTVSALTEQISTFATNGADNASANNQSGGSDDDTNGLGKESSQQTVPPLSRSPRLPRCDIKRCCCSCHATESITWKRWTIRYTPLTLLLRPCEQDICSARRYQLALRVHMSWLGIPVAVLLGGELVTGTAGYALRPSLQVRRLVRATSPGFEIFFRLEEDKIGTEVDKDSFRKLYRSDSTLKTHVNPKGHTYLQELVHYGPWGEYGHRNERQLEMIEFLVQELQITAGMDTDEFMYDVAKWSSEGCHLDVIKHLVRIGHGFEDADEPRFALWPIPGLATPYDLFGEPVPRAVDPFYIEFLMHITSQNPDFGTTHPLHLAVLRNNIKEAERWITKLGGEGRIAKIVNFLGQSALHMALAPSSGAILDLLLRIAPALKDKQDRWGFTPLMYAMAMGYQDAARTLIQHGADLSPRARPESTDNGGSEGSDFVSCAFIWGHEMMIWDLFGDLERNASNCSYNLWARFAEQVEELVMPVYIRTQRGNDWKVKFWDTLFSASSGPRNLNFVFGSDGRTLAHLVTHPDEARLLIDGGFSALNRQDISGEHCLFSVAANLAPKAVVVLVAAGADPLVRDNRGSTVLCRVLRKFDIFNPSLKEVFAIFSTLRALLPQTSRDNHGDTELSGDGCDCPCSEDGCLPADALMPVFRDVCFIQPRNVLWLFECLSIFQDLDRPDWAKQSILSLLRRFKLAELGIQHRCECAARGGHTTTEERFWDLIAEERMIETLEFEMARLKSLPTHDLQMLLFSEMRQSFRDLLAQREKNRLEKERVRNKAQKKTMTQANSDSDGQLSRVDYVSDRFISSIEVSLERIPLDLVPYLKEADPKEMVREYFKFIGIAVQMGELGHVDESVRDLASRIRLEWIVKFAVAMDLDLSGINRGLESAKQELSLQMKFGGTGTEQEG